MSEKEIHEYSDVEANGNFDRSWRDEKWDGRALSVAAQEISVEEKDMTIYEAIQANKMAIFWSLILSTCVIMEGYDTNLLGNFYAYRKSLEASSFFPATRTDYYTSIVPEEIWHLCWHHEANTKWLLAYRWLAVRSWSRKW